MESEEVRKIRAEFVASIPQMRSEEFNILFKKIVGVAFDKGFITCAKRVTKATL